jgi:plastocyanin
MKPTVALAFAACVLGPRTMSADPSGGTVTGRVLLLDNGHQTKPDDVWVYLQDVRRHRAHTSSTTTLPPQQIRQENEEFVPHVLVVPVGTVIAFPNLDKIDHNVFSPTDPPFDLGRYPTDPKGKTQKFEDAYDIEIYCDIHKSMWARVKVVDTDPRWIVAVDADGKFTIADVPPGTYKLRAWIHDSDEVTETVVVAPGGTSTVELHLQRGKMRPHLRKDGTAYPSAQYQHP